MIDEARLERHSAIASCLRLSTEVRESSTSPVLEASVGASQSLRHFPPSTRQRQNQIGDEVGVRFDRLRLSGVDSG